MRMNSPLVSTTWLSENLNRANLIILDASLKHSVKTNDQKIAAYIPKSLIFDWDKFSDLTNPLPHTMPNEDQFTNAAQELGINEDSIIVVYDNMGIYSSPRVWWMFLAMGFENCFVLDGGLPEWQKMGYPSTKIHETPMLKGNFLAKYKPGLISNREEVLTASTTKNSLIIDARSEARFHGKIAEPRPGLKSGHIPNAINIPFEAVLSEHKIRPKNELERTFSAIEKDKPLIFSCGSGVTACIDALAATIIGYKNISIYDGSWSEWGMVEGS